MTSVPMAQSLRPTVYWRVIPSTELKRIALTRTAASQIAERSRTARGIALSRRGGNNRRLEMQRHRLTRYLAVIGTIALAVPASAPAQAFGINEIGTCAASRGFAVTGSPCK